LANNPSDAPPAHRVPDFCERIGISKSTFWKYVKAGKIRVIRIGGRTLVPHGEALRLATEGARGDR
jgi:excisionase family DNA binding protein